MIKGRRITLIERITSFMIDEAIMFIPVFVITMFIEIRLINIGILKYFELAPLGFLFFYIAPFPTILMLVIDSLKNSYSNNSTDLFLALVPIILKVVICTCLESSTLQGTIGKKLIKCYVVNKDGDKIKFFNLLLKNTIKYTSIVIFPLIAILGFHNTMTRTFVVTNK